ncbi:MAG: VCBS repeat-containing protein, partial [Thermoplasmata archaeon]|nr:VCBS repeat-containing protein [Thermoplasmata archaeon]
MKRFLAIALVAVFLVSGLISILPAGGGEVTHSLYDDVGSPLEGGEIRIPTNGGVDTSYYVKVNRDVPISDATVDISTYGSAEGNALLDPYLDVGLDGNAEWEYTGTGYGKFGEQMYLSSGEEKVTATFSSSSGGSNAANSIYIPDDSIITGATLDLRGRYYPANLESFKIQNDPDKVNIKGFAMEYGDIDNDGWEDIVVTDTRNSRVVWMENPDGVRTVNWTVHTIYTGTYAINCLGLDIADMDGDGDIDVVVSSANLNDPYNAYYCRGSISYFSNNGASSWSRYTFGSYNRQNHYGGRVRIADIDKDGNPDVVVAPWYYYYSYYSNWIRWYKAPSNPNSASGWSARSIGSAPYNYMYIHNAMDVGDFNGDGYVDVAVGMSSYYSWGNSYKGLYIYTNPKTASGTWSRTRKDSGVIQPYTLETADLDGDNDVDIILGSFSDNNLYIYKNSNSGSFTRGMIDGNMPAPRSIIAMDVNGDNKTDVIASGGSSKYSVRIYEQNGTLSWIKHEISKNMIEPQSFAPYDYDKDNDVDIMVSGHGACQFSLLECKNRSTLTYDELVITDGGIKDIVTAEPNDFDDDGDLDLVFVAESSGFVGIWINDGTPFDGAGEIIHVGSMGNPSLVFWGDVDGDGHQDIIAYGKGGLVNWFSNPGNLVDEWEKYLALGGFDSGQAISYSFWAGDIDGDGRCDFAISRYGWSGGLIAWFQSPADPTTDTWQGYNIAPSVSYCRGIWGDDMDDDGDIDILAVMGTYGSGTASYYKNANPTATWSAVGIGGSMYYPETIRTVVRKDGYRDVVTTEYYPYSTSYQRVRFWKYNGGTSFSGVVMKTGASFHIATSDIGNDGYGDIFFNIGNT